MSALIHFNMAAEQFSGFSAEQILHNRGFYEIGRRTNANAWTSAESDAVIRISNDAMGSTEFFNLAQKMAGNPYMPVVLDQTTLPSGDHIACVEKLESAGHKRIYERYKPIDNNLKAGESVSESDVRFHEEVRYIGLMSATISDFFMRKGNHLDISTLPEPDAFREAAIAITELAAEVNKQDSRFVPGPDVNPTNVLWRRMSSGLVPVLYDPLIRQQHGHEEKVHTNNLRQKLGMTALEL